MKTLVLSLCVIALVAACGSDSSGSGGGSACLAAGAECAGADECAGFICECNDGSKSPGASKACAGTCSDAAGMQGLCDSFQCKSSGTKNIVAATCP